MTPARNLRIVAALVLCGFIIGGVVGHLAFYCYPNPGCLAERIEPWDDGDYDRLMYRGLLAVYSLAGAAALPAVAEITRICLRIIDAHRRWFRVSMRAAFAAITLFAIPLGWFANQVIWVRQRDAVFLERVGDSYLLREDSYIKGDYEAPAPAGLYFANYGISDLWIHRDRFESERERIQSLFPEARLHRWDSPTAQPYRN